MKQKTLAVAGDQNAQYEQYRWPAKRDVFLATMEKIVPLTDLAQVRGRRGETSEIERMQKRSEAGVEYINNWSFWLDLTNLVRTLGSLMGKYVY